MPAFAELGRPGEALSRGQTVLDGGPGQHHGQASWQPKLSAAPYLRACRGLAAAAVPLRLAQVREPRLTGLSERTQMTLLP